MQHLEAVGLDHLADAHRLHEAPFGAEKDTARPRQILGDHRVMCGDSTSQADAGTLLDGGRAVCLWTDPPYNVAYETAAGKIENDKLHKNLADAYYNIRVADKAIYHYEKAIRINSNLDEAHYNLSVLLYLQKSYFNAKMNIDKALQISSANEDYRELLAHIEEKIQCNNNL